MHMVTFYKWHAKWGLDITPQWFFLISASAYHRDDTLSLEILLQAEGTFQGESCENKRCHADGVTSDDREERNNEKRKQGSDEVKMTFLKRFPRHRLCLTFMDISDIKKNNPLQILKCRIIFSCLWFTRCSSESPNKCMNHEQNQQCGSVCGCILYFFFTPQKWDGYRGTDREIIWEDSTQYNDIAFYKNSPPITLVYPES